MVAGAQNRPGDRRGTAAPPRPAAGRRPARRRRDGTSAWWSMPSAVEALPCGSRSMTSTLQPGLGQGRGEVDRGGRLADAALLVGDRHDPGVCGSRHGAPAERDPLAGISSDGRSQRRPPVRSRHGRRDLGAHLGVVGGRARPCGPLGCRRVPADWAGRWARSHRSDWLQHWARSHRPASCDTGGDQSACVGLGDRRSAVAARSSRRWLPAVGCARTVRRPPMR